MRPIPVQVSASRASTRCRTSAQSVLADQQTPKAGRPLLWATGFSLCLVVVLAAVLMRGQPQEIDPGPVDVTRASPADAAAVLDAFVDSVDARDAQALAALAPAANGDEATILAGIGRNTRALDLRSVTARFVDQVGTVAPDGSWTGLVDLTWQLGDLDEAPSRADVAVSFAPDDGGLAIAGFGASGQGRVPLWLRGELSVARTDNVLVLVDGTQSQAAAVARRVERGNDVVRRVLPDWRGPVVVEMPASAADLDETLGASPGTYAAIAAVTTTAGSSTGTEAPVHVFVNPDVTDGLRRAGAQVVMSHELVHVATDAVRTPMEPWLLEGFADYVALRDTKLPDRVTLSRAIAAARREGVPAALPSAADFDTRAPDLQARYEEAWLACRVIAEELGERGLVGIYRASSDARRSSLHQLMRRTGYSSGRLLREWKADLRSAAN